jgi:ATP-dependent helicase/nuclease subunit B
VVGIRRVDVVAQGRPATEALARHVAAAKDGRPLAPVTVVVPSNMAGLTARRLLAAGIVGRPGLANVQFVTPLRLAELLSADLLAGRRDLTNPVLGAAVRQALRDEPGRFAEVADHQATEAALASMYAELSHLSVEGLAAVATGPGMAPEAVRLHRSIDARLEPFTGEDEIARTAARRPDLARVLAPWGALVWHLPQAVTPAQADLLRSVLGAAPASVVVGLTGETAVDAPVLATIRRCGVDLDDGAAGRIDRAVGSRIVSVTDADDEVRAVVREVVALAESGVPLDRMAVFYPGPQPYVRTLQQQFAAAGIPANGPSPQRLTDSVAGRTLLAALSLPAQRWRRDRVMALLSSGPIRQRDGWARTPSWERLSRREGIVQDLGDWRGKLDRAAERHARELAELDEPDHDDRGRADTLRRQQADALALRTFVDDLAAAVAAFGAAVGWADKSEAALALLHSLLGPEHRRGTWPADEQDAAARVEDALARLAALDEIDPDPPTEVFRRALVAELDVPRGRNGRFGEGVHYGPLVSAVGHDLDAVFVLGMTEGQCPRPRRDDTLVPDAARALAPAGELPARTARIHDEHRALLAALSAAPPDRRWLLHPRGDLRGGRERLPSRWLLDTASALAGTRVYSTEFADLAEPVVEVVASFTDGLTRATTPGSALERDLSVLHGHVGLGGDPAAHPAAAAARRGLLALSARRSSVFTEWDGNLGGLPVPSPARGEMLSATRLERWAACGFRYFLADVLGLRDRDDPERVVDLDARDRGSAMHAVLEEFVQEVIDAGPPDPTAPWSDEHRQRIHEIAHEVFGEYEARGRTGRPVHWKIKQREISALLDGFLLADHTHRSGTLSVPVATELAFGFDDDEPVRVDLGDGRIVTFRGRIDRVDRSDDGRFVVSDYKSGKGEAYKGIGEGDPVRGGQILQLGLYAEAVSQHLGAGEVHSQYWMVDKGERLTRHGYPWTSARRTRFVDVVRAIVDGIEQGVFPALPGDWDSWRGTHENCTYCDFDDLCPRDRGDHAENKVAAPELRVREVLTPAVEEEEQ